MVNTSTCIVSLKHNGIVYIGGDSCAGNSYKGFSCKTKKVFHVQDRRELVIGYTTSFRMRQLLQYTKNLFDDDDFIIENKINTQYLINTFVPNIQKLFDTGGFESTKNNVRCGGIFILGYKNELFLVQDDYSILESFDDYIACGCGESFALGSLVTTEGKDFLPEERIKLALEAASKFSYGVSPPFYVVSTNNLETKIL